MTATIKEAITAFGQQFQEVRHTNHSVANPTNNIYQALAGNKTTGTITGTLLKFLQTPNLPPYYQLKSHLTLSGADEEDEAWENLAVCRHHLNAAEKALAECKDAYKDASDVKRVQAIEAVIKEEWGALQEREKAGKQRW